MAQVRVIPKHSPAHASEELTYRLYHYEYKCKCNYDDCDVTLIHESLRDSWSLARHDFKQPLRVNSGFRCQKHNDDVGGSPRSRHMKGLAVDISFEEYGKNQRERLHNILREYFDVVITYPTFFHCHNLISSL